MDQTRALVQSLEKKVFKKFEFIDAGTKKHEEEFYKIKNELTTNKSNLEAISKTIAAMKGDTENLGKVVDDFKNEMKEVNETLISEFNEKLENTKNYFLEQIEE